MVVKAVAVLLLLLGTNVYALGESCSSEFSKLTEPRTSDLRKAIECLETRIIKLQGENENLRNLLSSLENKQAEASRLSKKLSITESGKALTADNQIAEYTVQHDAERSLYSPPLNKTVLLCDQNFSITYRGEYGGGEGDSIFSINGERWRAEPGYYFNKDSNKIRLTVLYMEYLKDKKTPVLMIKCQPSS